MLGKLRIRLSTLQPWTEVEARLPMLADRDKGGTKVAHAHLSLKVSPALHPAFPHSACKTYLLLLTSSLSLLHFLVFFFPLVALAHQPVDDHWTHTTVVALPSEPSTDIVHHKAVCTHSDDDDDVDASLQKDYVGTRTAMCPICHWSMLVQSLFTILFLRFMHSSIKCMPLIHKPHIPFYQIGSHKAFSAGAALEPEGAADRVHKATVPKRCVQV